MCPAHAPLRADDPVVRAVRSWLDAGHIAASAPLLVACSGGADSLALAAAVHQTTQARPPAASPSARGDHAGVTRQVTAAVIDHGLQPGSAQVAAAAAAQLRHLGYASVTVRRVAVGTEGGLEAAARAARYEALGALATELGDETAVLLAHTQNDQAETVLLGLGRGSGPRSIAGMQPWRAPWARPLLGVSRRDTENACRELGLTPWRDPHNTNPTYTRVRLRREVLPLLDEVLGGGVHPALARTAELMRDDLAALDAVALRAAAETVLVSGAVDCRALSEWPSAVRRRVLRHWVRTRLGDSAPALTYRHLVALEEAVIRGHSGWQVRLPGGADVRRVGATLYLGSLSPTRPTA